LELLAYYAWGDVEDPDITAAQQDNPTNRCHMGFFSKYSRGPSRLGHVKETIEIAYTWGHWPAQVLGVNMRNKEYEDS
jgi:hypothetical protein